MAEPRSLQYTTMAYGTHSLFSSRSVAVEDETYEIRATLCDFRLAKNVSNDITIHVAVSVMSAKRDQAGLGMTEKIGGLVGTQHGFVLQKVHRLLRADFKTKLHLRTHHCSVSNSAFQKT